MSSPHPHYELIALRHSADAVIVEFWLRGAHRGMLGKIPPTGSSHRTRVTAYFVFDGSEHLVTERVYSDRLTVLRQLLAGLDRRKPAGLLKLARVLRGALSEAGAKPDPRLLTTAEPDLGPRVVDQD
ncbi:hypothetical protein EES43_26175 [Streptomyces sp. ADI96-02]|uniref:hypothetical protein n=1 Tax=Streptomyces sp. ADI96-02 TaxID=1522760 RepID=UPI000FC06DF0|nr:hypothetical protein [Streptomyces sp. ADI96-02]RPK55614.1 hypothetical protein EES43_26175 [Streptomyces sp. ADI96-02]